MGLYINRIKYKGGSPRLGASSGVINNAVVDGYYFYDDDYNQINYVTELKMSNPRNVNGSSISVYANLNTGITFNQDLKWRAVFVTYKSEGGYIFGGNGSGTSSYRAFTYGTQLYFDVGSSRIGAGWGVDGMPVDFNGTTVYDITFNNFFYTNNNTGVTYNPGGHAISTINSNFYICLDSIGIRALQIYDSTGTSLVFDGWPALDGNNQPCLYDKISQTYKYFTVPSGSASGYVTYKSLTLCNLTLSINDATMGSTTGAGTYYVGDTVSIAASSNTGYRFVGWYDGNTLVSSNSTYSFTIYGNVSYEARFEAIPQYTITLSVNDATMGSASGSGTYYDGDTVSIAASPNTGYKFVGWYDGNTLVSSIVNYSFVINGNVSYEARFEVSTGNYTLVKYIYLTTPDTSNTVWVDTGIKSNNNLELRTQCYITRANGWLYVGHTGTNTPAITPQADSNDFRWFYYVSKFNLDVGSSRNAGSAQILNQDIDISMIVNGSSARLVNNSTSTNLCSMTWSGSINNKDIFILLNGMKFTSLVITNTDNVVLFNGHAAIDNSNVPCVYDSVSGNLIYPYRYTQTSGTVVMYEPY